MRERGRKRGRGVARVAAGVAEFAAQAAIKKATGEATARRTMAEADAAVITMTGDAEARKTQAIGGAEAGVIKQKAEAISADSFVAIEVARSLAGSGQKLVPDISAGGQGGRSTLVEMLMAGLIKDVVAARTAKENRTSKN